MQDRHADHDRAGGSGVVARKLDPDAAHVPGRVTQVDAELGGAPAGAPSGPGKRTLVEQEGHGAWAAGPAARGAFEATSVLAERAFGELQAALAAGDRGRIQQAAAALDQALGAARAQAATAPDGAANDRMGAVLDFAVRAEPLLSLARDGGASPADLAARGTQGAGGALPHLDRIQSSFGHHDVSGIRAHVGGEAATSASALGARAYAQGDAVGFASTPDLHTAAHEAAHVVQQRGGVQLAGGLDGGANDPYEQHADAVADAVVRGESAEGLLDTHATGGRGSSSAGSATVQRRRLPSNTAAMLTDPSNPAQPGANYAANAAGTHRLIELAEDELTPAQRTQVHTAMLAGQTQAEFNALPEQTRLTRRVEAIRHVRPDLTLGDPNLIDTGPRPATSDAANINSLVASANAIFDAIASGSRDTDVGQIFGHAHIATAKAKYANGKTWMNQLHATNHIVTDRSGYNREVHLGGLTGFHRQISLAPTCIDSPTNAESIVTLVHESMHAGNADVSDKGYIGTQVFTQLPEAVKLTNAAHFEVIARRILGAPYAYSGQTFTPAGTASPSGPTTAPLTPLQQAVRDASERIRIAWTMGLNLHTLYDTLYKNQALWDVPRGGGSFHQGLPYWSKVEKLTIHLKTSVDPASTNPARLPISQIDMALSEGVTRRFAMCMSAIGSVPNDAPGATSFLSSHATPTEIAAAQTTPAAHRDLWIKVALRLVGSITGPEQRDLRVIHELFGLSTSFGTVLHHRDLSGFPY